MKGDAVILKMTTLFASVLLPLAQAKASPCVDVSGKYRPPYETENSDVVTTVIYNQRSCDSLSIGGYAVGKPHFESLTRIYGPQNLSLKGLPSPLGSSCLYNSFPGACASYLATKNFILKTNDSQSGGMSFDPNHGGCFFTVSRLFKDSSGNLIEQPQAAKCEDGFLGDVAPIIWPKAN